MSNVIRAKAAYVVHTMVGRDTSSEYNPVVGFFVSVAHYIKAQYWLIKINHMTDGEILNMYYLLTDGSAEQ